MIVVKSRLKVRLESVDYFCVVKTIHSNWNADGKITLDVDWLDPRPPNQSQRLTLDRTDPTGWDIDLKTKRTIKIRRLPAHRTTPYNKLIAAMKGKVVSNFDDGVKGLFDKPYMYGAHLQAFEGGTFKILIDCLVKDCHMCTLSEPICYSREVMADFKANHCSDKELMTWEATFDKKYSALTSDLQTLKDEMLRSGFMGKLKIPSTGNVSTLIPKHDVGKCENCNTEKGTHYQLHLLSHDMNDENPRKMSAKDVRKYLSRRLVCGLSSCGRNIVMHQDHRSDYCMVCRAQRLTKKTSKTMCTKCFSKSEISGQFDSCVRVLKCVLGGVTCFRSAIVDNNHVTVMIEFDGKNHLFVIHFVDEQGDVDIPNMIHMFRDQVSVATKYKYYADEKRHKNMHKMYLMSVRIAEGGPLAQMMDIVRSYIILGVIHSGFLPMYNNWMFFEDDDPIVADGDDHKQFRDSMIKISKPPKSHIDWEYCCDIVGTLTAPCEQEGVFGEGWPKTYARHIQATQFKCADATCESCNK